MPFKYRPLNEADDEIRLLMFTKSQNGDDEDQIGCMLEQVPLKNITLTTDYWDTLKRIDPWSHSKPYGAPKIIYAAVSYVWGDDRDCRSILLNRNPFPVRQNLYNALRELRRLIRNRDEPSFETFWVDYICIDQSNVEERSRQVQRMRFVYGTAEVVYCFLPLTWTATYTTGQNSRVNVEEAIDPIIAVETLDTLHQYCNRPRDFIEDLRSGETSMPECQWVQLFRFFNNPYWQRLWIIQEICLAQTAMIVLGDHLVPWTKVAEVADIIRYARYPIEDLMTESLWAKGLHASPHWYGVTKIEWLRRQRQGMWRANDTYWAVDLVRRSRCADARDKVYGILSLLPNDWARMIQVDYGKSVTEVWMDFVVSGVEWSYGLLNALPHSSMPKSDGTPSWLADLNDDNVLREFRDQDLCRAAWGLAGRTRIERGELYVRGLILDSIDGLTRQKYPRRSHLSMDAVDDVHPIVQADRGSIDMTDADMGSLLVRTLMSTVAMEASFPSVLPPLRWLQDNAEQSRGARGTLSFFERNGGFVLPNGRMLADLLNTQKEEPGMDFSDVVGAIEYQVSLRKLASTRAGRLALVPQGARKGDCLCVLGGFQTLAVLRRKDEGSWYWMGNGFMEGVMRGEGVVGRHDDVREFIIA